MPAATGRGKDSPPPPSWKQRVAAVGLAVLTLGLLMQMTIFAVALPFCGCKWGCLQHWFRSFISHIDGPFKVFTFAAAISRAAANPSVWLGRLEGVIHTMARCIKGPEDFAPPDEMGPGGTEGKKLMKKHD